MLATPGLILLNGNQTVNSLSFTGNYTLGTYGTNQTLTDSTGSVSVSSGSFATINASYAGTNGVTLTGGGSLFLNHPLPTFSGNTFIELNKGNALNPTAITGDLELNGGIVIYNFDNQIADASNVVLNRGVINLNGKSEVIASATIRSGGILTNPTTLVQPFNTLSITGDLEVTGYDDYGGVTTGFTVGNNSTVTVGGQIRIGTLGRVHLAEGQTAAVLNVNGGLQMTGALLTQNSGAGTNIVRLSSDVTTFAAISPSRIGDSVDTDTFLGLSGTRTFTVADGPAALDLIVSTVIRDSTTPAAPGSGLTKSGPGVTLIGQQAVSTAAGGTANSYSGPTVVNAGTLVLHKNANVNALGNGSATNTLTIGDGVGGFKADQVIIRNNEQIANTTDVTLASSGLLDLDTFNTSETIANLTGAAGSAITLGPTSTLTVTSTGATTFSGNIAGDSVLTKAGGGTLTLDGTLYVFTINVTAGTLNLNSDANNATLNAGSTTNINVANTLTALNIADGKVVTFGPGPGPSPFADAAGKGSASGSTLDLLPASDLGASAATGSAVVPEPASLALLMVGALGLLGRRRRA